MWSFSGMGFLQTCCNLNVGKERDCLVKHIYFDQHNVKLNKKSIIQNQKKIRESNQISQYDSFRIIISLSKTFIYLFKYESKNLKNFVISSQDYSIIKEYKDHFSYCFVEIILFRVYNFCLINVKFCFTFIGFSTIIFMCANLFFVWFGDSKLLHV